MDFDEVMSKGGPGRSQERLIYSGESWGWQRSECDLKGNGRALKTRLAKNGKRNIVKIKAIVNKTADSSLSLANVI